MIFFSLKTYWEKQRKFCIFYYYYFDSHHFWNQTFSYWNLQFDEFFKKIWEIACSPTWCRWKSRTRPDRLSWSFSRLWRRFESNHATTHSHKSILGGVMARTFQWSWRQWRKSMFSRTITELTVGSLWILLKKI